MNKYLLSNYCDPDTALSPGRVVIKNTNLLNLLFNGEGSEEQE